MSITEGCGEMEKLMKMKTKARFKKYLRLQKRKDENIIPAIRSQAMSLMRVRPGTINCGMNRTKWIGK